MHCATSNSYKMVFISLILKCLFFLIALVVRSPLQVRSFYFLYKSANFLQLSAELLLATIAFFVKYISAAL
jgi:hypothetical protein